MTANRSLDEFGGGPDAPAEEPAACEEGHGDGERPADGSRGVRESEVEGDVEPPVSTYTWSPEGGPCAACGSRAEERWRAGDDMVCAGCKEW